MYHVIIMHQLLNSLVPDALVVRSIPHYLFREGYLIRIDTSFKVAVSNIKSVLHSW